GVERGRGDAEAGEETGDVAEVSDLAEPRLQEDPADRDACQQRGQPAEATRNIQKRVAERDKGVHENLRETCPVNILRRWGFRTMSVKCILFSREEEDYGSFEIRGSHQRGRCSRHECGAPRHRAGGSFARTCGAGGPARILRPDAGGTDTAGAP